MFIWYDIFGIALGTLRVVFVKARATVLALSDWVFLGRSLRCRCESSDLAAEFSEQSHYRPWEVCQWDKDSVAACYPRFVTTNGGDRGEEIVRTNREIQGKLLSMGVRY